LLHGFPEFWYGWKHQIEPLASMGYRVIAPDQRGYNLSDKPEAIEDYTLNILRDDIIGLINHFGKKKAIIIGHDWGGSVAWHLAATKPEYVEKLIAINVPHPKAMPRVMLRNPLQWVRSSYMAFFQLPDFPEQVLSADEFNYMKKAIAHAGKPDSIPEEELEKFKEAWLQPGALTGMLNWYRALRKGSITQTPGGLIQVPVRILWGLGDQLLSKELAKESLKFCEDGNLAMIGESTHWVHHEQSTIINHLIAQFLNEEKRKLL
ncbi:MAG TPA: alpha/beta hydrolase, partial [Planococcus sp. (in: firmicutes)]|nr:alpha/beta hydrolase [Planococcus sp. (in: firmicutes)]